MTDSKLWTARELAEFLGYSEKTVARMVSQSPEKLPPRVMALTRPRWEPSVVMDWIKGSSIARIAARAGRPRNSV